MTEKKLAKKDGARLVKNSGRGWEKGDAILARPDRKGTQFIVDYKEYASSFSITKDAWRKLKRDGWNQNQREPCISLVLDGEVRIGIVDWDLLLDMINIYWEKEDGS